MRLQAVKVKVKANAAMVSRVATPTVAVAVAENATSAVAKVILLETALLLALLAVLAGPAVTVVAGNRAVPIVVLEVVKPATTAAVLVTWLGIATKVDL